MAESSSSTSTSSSGSTNSKPLSGAGLRGQSAGETSLSTVGKAGAGLTYRGYDITVLAEKASFEEVAHLLLRGALPNRSQLAAFAEELKRSRELPTPLLETLERLPADAHPMDVLRTGVSALGSFEPEDDFGQQQRVATRLLAAMPSILLYWYRFTRDGTKVNVGTTDDSIAGHFLHLLTGKSPSDAERRLLDVSLILYAEHEFNASTFAARVCASTLSDLYSCVVAALGTLRGPLHGGANEKAMDMIDKWTSPDEAEQGILAMLAAKAKIMGFGHAIYRESDPRSAIIQGHAERLSKSSRERENLYAMAKRVHEVMWREKKLFPNADFYHAPAYRFIGIPTPLFTPIFACARVSGWCAHVFEQRANNRIIRPSADYVGPMSATWVDLKDRP
jgi:2-methylcitrate synthase